MTLPPLPDLREALSALLKYAEINECQHDETHRGGVIWTICDGCGRKWADDRNPFKGYQEPAEITNARAAIAAHVPEAGCGNIAAVPAHPVSSDVLREALSFYADETRYHGPNQTLDAADKWTEQVGLKAYRLDVTRDRGVIAKKALAAAPQAVPVPAGWSVTYDGKRASYIYADQETAEFEAQQVGGTARAVAVYLAAAPKEQPHE